MSGKTNTNLKLGLILPLAILVIISGCAGSTTGGSGPGIAVLNFEASPDTGIRSDDNVELRLRIQNQGELTAEDVELELIDIVSNEWGRFEKIKTLGNLKASDPETNTPGEIRTETWKLRAPTNVPKNIVWDYEPRVVVTYDYKTSALKRVTLIDEDELRRIKDNLNVLPTDQIEVNRAPLTVDIQTGNYIKTSKEGTSYDVFPVYIKITNVGLGAVISERGLGGEELYPFDITIIPPTGTRFIYTNYGNEECTTGVVRTGLWTGKEAEITCELEVTNPPDYTQSPHFTVELSYRYKIESLKTTVTVTGTGE